MPDPVHLLTDPAAGFHAVTVVCGSRTAQHASWQREAVTCPQCLSQRLGPRMPRVERASKPGDHLSEKQFLAQVRQFAREHQWLTFHSLRSVGSEPGWVDLVCLRPPVLVLAELKTAGGRVTPAQQRWLDGLGQVTTVQTYLWRPQDLGSILEVLRQYP